MAARLPWWRSGRTMRDLHEELKPLWTARPNPNPYPNPNPALQQRWAVDFVLLSCKLEQTVPASLSLDDVAAELHDTFQLCQQPDLSYCFTPVSAPWPSDGSPDDLPAITRQLVQHMKALCYICSAPSTFDAALLRTTHSILLNNATNDYGIPLPPAGAYRTHPASTSSGKLCFSDSHHIARTVNEEMIRYTSASKSGIDQVMEAVARLFYGVIIAHPFTDGNGRVCRLLVAAALMREGVPFPMLMHNGHKKYRLHYMSVTQHAFDHGNTDRLQCYILECLLFWWTKFVIESDM